ncbi:MAG: nitroreductase family protein, partial [Candidatus Bathyarchaeia archaeon]
YHDSYSWIADHMYLVDVTIATDHLTLAARNEGLGTCWVGAFDEDLVSDIVRTGPGIKPVALIPVGYPRHMPAAKRRRNLSEVIHEETYKS